MSESRRATRHHAGWKGRHRGDDLQGPLARLHSKHLAAGKRPALGSSSYDAEIARFVSQRKPSLTVDTYTHVLGDGRELDYEEVLR